MTRSGIPWWACPAAVCVGLLALIAMVDCHGTAGGPSPEYPLFTDLGTDKLFTSKDILRVGTMQVPVEVKHTTKGEDLVVSLRAHDTVFEQEIYRKGPNEFLLVEALSQQFNPPIQLLHFPFHVGDTYEWGGVIQIGNQPKKATAHISTSKERIKVAASPELETVQVDVRLKIDTGVPANPRELKLSFWFAPGRGLVKRQFGPESSREPAE